MKILVVCQHYCPEPFRITDLCRLLTQRGHEVTVVTGLPNYPMGRIYDGYRGGKKRRETIDGVHVHRCFTIGRRTGSLWRILNYISFAVSGTLHTGAMKEAFDAVLVYQLSPVTMAYPALRYRKKHGTRTVLYCLDLWPESLTAGGIGKDSPIFRLIGKISEKIYRGVDQILVTSRLFPQYFQENFSIPAETIGYLPQYAEAMFTPESCRKEPGETVDLLFAGNVGAAQSVQTLIRAASLTKDRRELRWHIVGDGSELERCRELARQLEADNVIFHGRQSMDKMPEFYRMADAMLISLGADPVISRTLPGKMQTYMAAGKPILGSIDGEAARVIREADCGLCAGAEDPQTLADIAAEFCEKRSDWSRWGENASSYCNTVFDRERILSQLEAALIR